MTKTDPSTAVGPKPAGRNLRRFAEPLGWLVLALAAVWLLTGASIFQMFLGGLVIIYAISALGLDWVQGRAGQVSIGSAAFMAVGAYITATFAEMGFPLLLCLLFATIGGALVGLIVGLPALRLRDLYLALSTLALQFLAQASGLQYETSTGHDAGFSLPPPAIGSLALQGKTLLIALIVVLVVVILVVRNLYRRAPGRAWMAIRESQMAASVIGINVTRWKLSAFVASSAVISLSGGLLAYYTFRVFNETFTLNFALSFLAMIIIGGLGSIVGAILGATLITLAPYLLSALTSSLPPGLPLAQWFSSNIFYINNGLYGILLLVFLLYQPRGIMGLLAALVKLVTPRRRNDQVRVELEHIETVERDDIVDKPAANSVLEITELSLVYRTGARAVSELDLHVGPGEIVALLGRNGAGKTSTLRAISGFFKTDRSRLSGSVKFNGAEILGSSPISTSRQGLILVPERDKVFKNLTVAEHFRLVGASDADRKQYEELFPPLATRSKSPAGLLSGGERQMLALALAWSMNPKLLLIDELSLGLSPAATKTLTASLREFRDRTQVPILVVEQNVAAAINIADRVYIMEAGRLVHASNASDVSRETVLQWSFGER